MELSSQAGNHRDLAPGQTQIESIFLVRQLRRPADTLADRAPTPEEISLGPLPISRHSRALPKTGDQDLAPPNRRFA